MSNTCTITTKSGQQRTLSAKASYNSRSSSWHAFVMDEDAGYIVASTPNRYATEEKALESARNIMNQLAKELERRNRPTGQ